MNIEDKYWDYALNMMEQAKRRKKTYNGYKDKADRMCFYTGVCYAERHEVFGGSNRKKSIELGLQVDLCPEKHEELHRNCTPWAKEENAKWRYVYERLYLDALMKESVTEKMALRYWMALIGRNYIEELMPE